MGGGSRRVIGIDPGLAHTGFGVIDAAGARLSLVSYGVIETSSADSHEVRLLSIYNGFCKLLAEFSPSEAEMETLFFSRNTTSAMAVAEAKGVISLSLAQRGVPLFLYAPNQIKLSVTGSKSSSKEAVSRYVKILLELQEEPQPDHASDALAGAITHIHHTLF